MDHSAQNDDWIGITTDPLDTYSITESVRSNLSGAIVLFLGTVREITGDKQTLTLDYESHNEMALKKMNAIAQKARSSWPLEKVTVVHRVGHLELGDVCVAVAVSSPHRKEAFEAASEIMNEIKKTVPIWKKENWADGSSDWVHPGMEEKGAGA